MKNKYKQMEWSVNRLLSGFKHELNCHILLNDEVTWNEEFYTNGKLDYRKLLISFCNDVISELEPYEIKDWEDTRGEII